MIKVLAIDDNKDVLFSIKVALEELDPEYKVTTADCGEKGIELSNSLKPDVIILDIMMPDIVGWVVNRKIKANPKTKSIPVIFLTARTDAGCQVLGKSDADVFMTKPFEPVKLDSAIKDLLNRKNEEVSSKVSNKKSKINKISKEKKKSDVSSKKKINQNKS